MTLSTSAVRYIGKYATVFAEVVRLQPNTDARDALSRCITAQTHAPRKIGRSIVWRVKLIE
jgi:hypothetical protein